MRRLFEVNSEPHTGARPSVRLCVGLIKPDIFTLPRCKSAELFFSSCDSVAALALATCNEHVAEANITAPAHTQCALHGAQGSWGKSGKITSFSCSGYSRAFHRHFLFPVPYCHTEFLTVLRSSPPFLCRVLPASRLLLRARLFT